jgi:YidC/Oxa1 family membrane protein insertase
MLGLLGAPIGVAYHIVFGLAQFLTPLPGGLATAVAIIVFTMGVRLLLAPLSLLAYRGQASISALQPKIAELRQRHASQPDRLQQELAALYRAEGGGMLSGCLPLLLQLPFFSVMYRLFLSKTVGAQPNALLARKLLTTPLGTHWLTGAGPLSIHGLVFLGLFAALAVVAFLTARAAGDTGGNALAGQPAKLGALGRILPYTTLIIAAFVPLAAGLYLVTTTGWTAAERAVLRWWHRRAGPVTGTERQPG